MVMKKTKIILLPQEAYADGTNDADDLYELCANIREERNKEDYGVTTVKACGKLYASLPKGGKIESGC